MEEELEENKNTTIDIKIDGEKEMTFPISPESFSISGEMSHEATNINGLGEILLKGNKGLRTFGWTSFFPAQSYSFNQVDESELVPALEYCKKIDEWKTTGQTVQVVISDFIEIDCVISKFEYGMEERGKDVAYTISFMEDVSVDTPNVKTQTAKRPTKSVKSHLYKWKKGDTWKKVAKKETGKESNYSKLKKTNKSRIDKAIKAYKKKHNVKKVKETTALIGTKVLIKV